MTQKTTTRTHHTLTVSLSPDMLDLVDRMCEADNRTHAELVRESLRHYFKTRAFAEHRLPPRNPFLESVARRAYELYLQRGESHGLDREDWSQAMRELDKRMGGDRRQADAPLDRLNMRKGGDRRGTML